MYSASRVWARFLLTSLCMWILPLIVLKYLLPKLAEDGTVLSGGSSFWAGMAAVIAVNLVMAVYVVMALRDPPVASEPHPDPQFLEQARKKLGELTDETVKVVKTDTTRAEKAKDE